MSVVFSPLAFILIVIIANICLDHLLPLPDGYTFYSVSQERIMDEIDEEAKRARMQGPKTGANWDARVAFLFLDCVTWLRRDLCGHWCHRFIFLGRSPLFMLRRHWFWRGNCVVVLLIKTRLVLILLKFVCQWKGLIHWPLHDLTYRRPKL